MPDPWPDLDGECPDDWDPIHWLAATTLHGGGSLREAGERVDRQRGTVSGWVTRWRAQYGPGFLKDNRQGSTLSPDDMTKGRLLASQIQKQGWAAVRVGAAADHAVTAAMAREALQKGLSKLLDDEARLAALEPKDFRLLAVVADVHDRRADALLDAPDHRRLNAERHRASGTPDASSRPPIGLLAGLEGAEADEVAEAQRDAIESAEVFFVKLAASDGEPVEDEPMETTARNVS